MPPWTPELVADRLVAAYRRVTGSRAIRSVSVAGGHHLVAGEVRGAERDLPGSEVEELIAAFRWPELYVADARDRRYLRNWASCRASGESIRERCRDLEWPRSTAERRRLASLATIARSLNRGSDLTQA